ncbi:MAG: histidine kinase [Saprospirales bacterium]|nr:histidine kinase [Saprospirales bacterium]
MPAHKPPAIHYLWIPMKRLFLHIILWAAYAAVEYVANLPHYADRNELLRQTLFFIPVIAVPFYLVAYVLVPQLLWKRRKVLFWISCAIVFVLVLIIRIQWTNWYWFWIYGHEFSVPLSKISKNLFRDYAVISFAVSLKIIRDWDRKDRLTNQLHLEKRDAELQFLRAQIHPHFLFNTLNNLYGLALRQSPHTPDSILRLSGLLDFILYECNAERIPLQKEITLIGDYANLERLRFGDRLQLVFEHDHPPESVRIAPCCFCLLSKTPSSMAPAPPMRRFLSISTCAWKIKRSIFRLKTTSRKTAAPPPTAPGESGCGMWKNASDFCIPAGMH